MNRVSNHTGTYVLILECVKARQITVGRRGPSSIFPGYYLYVGSAFGPGGLEARIRRHARREKRLRWHIDYLRAHSKVAAVWFSTADRRLEHCWAAALSRMPGLVPVPRFGASDCGCPTHLFHSEDPPSLAAFRRVTRARISERRLPDG